MNVFEAVRDAVTARQAAELYGLKIRDPAKWYGLLSFPSR